MVKDLLDEESGAWKHNIISDTFLFIDRDQILKIPIIHETKEDQLMWNHTKDGCYTVRSGYNAIYQWQKEESTEPTTTNCYSTVWKRLWAIQAIPRHQTFLWRILNDALPVKSNLIKKGV